MLTTSAERLKARAVAALVDFDAIDAHAAEGFATPERHMIVLGHVVDREAARLQRIVRFCAKHTLVADALETGDITVDHADILRTAAQAVGAELFDDDVLDLLRAASGVDFSVFKDRIDAWTWRKTPEQTEDNVGQLFENRSVTIQSDIYGGGRRNFSLEAGGMASLVDALETKPDPFDSFAPQPTLAQRQR